jgi:Family of unknown function (DUF5320)
MPRFDGTGPTGSGSMTGRGQGYCVTDNPGSVGRFVRLGSGLGRGLGRGLGYGLGLALGRGAGFGRRGGRAGRGNGFGAGARGGWRR